MARNRSRANPPPPPPAEEPRETMPKGEESDEDPHDDNADDMDRDGEPEPDTTGMFPDESIPAARVDDRIELPSPSSSAQGVPRLPDLPPIDNTIATPTFLGQPPPPPPVPDYRQQQDPGGGAFDDDRGGGMPEQPRRDGDPAREAGYATAGRETDVLVNAFVDYEDIDHGGQMVSCGHLQRITMSRAVMPETYIPTFEGTFWIRMYHATNVAGQIGRPLGQPFAHRSTGAPFVRGWRVDMDMDKIVADAVARALAPYGIQPTQGGFAPVGQVPAPGQVPAGVFTGQMGTFQQIIENQNKRIDQLLENQRKLEEERRVSQIVDPLRDAVRSLEAKIEKMGNGGNGSNNMDALKVVAEVLTKREESADRAEDRQIRMYELKHGSQAVATQFNMMAAVSEMQMKMLERSAKANGLDWNSIGDKLIKFQEMQTKQRREEMEFREGLIEKREERAERKEQRKAAATEHAKRVSRNIDAMLEGIVEAMRNREPPDRVAKLVNIFTASAVEFRWSEFDGSMGELLRDFGSSPEKPITLHFAPKAGFGKGNELSAEDGGYLLAICAQLRKLYGLPVFDPRKEKQQTTAGTTPAAGPSNPSPAAGAPATDAAPKEPAAPSTAGEASTPAAPAPEKPNADPPPAAEPTKS